MRAIVVGLIVGGIGVASLPGSAGAAGSHRCRVGTYAPRGGGYALILERLTVSGVTCKQAAKVGGASVAMDPVPAGWRCASADGARYRCRRGAAHFTFAFGGSAD